MMNLLLFYILFVEICYGLVNLIEQLHLEIYQWLFLGRKQALN